MILGLVFSKYLIKTLLKWVLIINFGITIIITLFEFSELVRKASSKLDISFIIMIKMLLLKLPYLVAQLFPFIILFSSIMTFWQLNRYQEITVMKAAGISIWQTLSPLMGTVWLLGLIELCILNPLSAHFMARYAHLDDYYFQGNINNLSISESGVWVREKTNSMKQVFHIMHFDPETKKAQQISVFQYSLQDKFLKRLEAQSGHFEADKIVLHSVWEQVPHMLPHFSGVVILPTNLTIQNIQNKGVDPHCVSFWELPNVARILEHSGLSGQKYNMHWQALFAQWVWLGVMIILAAACSLRPIRQQGTLALIGIGAVSAFLLYFLRDITYALGGSNTLPIVLAAWTPVGISALLGITALLHFEEG